MRTALFEPPHDDGHPAPQAADAAGITYRQLDHWTRTGLLRPGIRDAAGPGSRRLYSTRDVVLLGVAGRLAAAGIGLPRIRAALALLDGQPLHGAVLLGDTDHIRLARSSAETIAILAAAEAVFAIDIGAAAAQVAAALRPRQPPRCPQRRLPARAAPA